MDRLIQPLSDILKNYPEISAKVIVIISTIFTAISAAYISLKEQEKKKLEATITLEKSRATISEGDRKRLEEQEQKIRQMLESERKMLADLRQIQSELNNLERKNFTLEADLKFTREQEKLNQMIQNTQNIINDVEQANLGREERRSAVRETIAHQAQRRKHPISILEKLFNPFK